jgi:hypothetical protein
VDTLQAQIFNNLIKCLAKINDEATPAPAIS